MKPNPQKPLTADLRRDLDVFRKDIQALREEVELKLHLASADLKADWQRLEPQLSRALTDAAEGVAADLKKRLDDFREQLRRN